MIFTLFFLSLRTEIALKKTNKKLLITDKQYNNSQVTNN